jgi:hypothetical protein
VIGNVIYFHFNDFLGEVLSGPQGGREETDHPGGHARPKARGLAEVDLVKAELAYRQAFVTLTSLLGKL